MSSLLQSPNKNDRQTLSIDEMMSEDEARRRREQLERRPSYRMILKDIAAAADKPLKKEIEDSNDRTGNGGLLGPPSGPINSDHFQVPSTVHPNNSGASNQSQQQQQNRSGSAADSSTSPGGNTVTLRLGGPSPVVSTAAATLASAVMRNQQNEVGDPLASRLLGGQQQQQPPRSNVSDIPSQPQPQLHASGLGPQLGIPNGLLLPVSHDLLNLKPATDPISLSTSMANYNGDWTNGILSQYNVGNNNGHSPLAAPNLANRQGSASLTSLSDNDDGSRKRQVRLLKNREAAKECRRKKKEYVKCLENRVAVLENQNKALIDELKALKEMYCRKEKN